ncbi:helix-turn-helix domain-containing protein [Glutamicibacter sp.]|uniref:helix-turn-helix domain-containing protein n=1 Tax=Glutamicibacter sp. TaxID=1931995 RepID=UPI0028BD4849|nr:helix-turn-helix domain-containing protein [Glutamicibacter sp.]
MKTLPVESSGSTINIGARLRGVRQQQRMTIDQVAELSGLTKGFLSRVERDLTSPSVSTLIKLCEVLGIDVGTLFEVPETQLVRLVDAPRVSLGGEGITEQLVTPRGEKRVQVIRAEVAPQGAGEAELYSVDCELEVLHVVSGQFTLVLPDQRWELEAGDTITFPGREPHSWENLSDEPALVLWTLIL